VAFRINPANELVCTVDDDGSVGRALRRLFKSAGYDAEVFASAEEYLAREGNVAASAQNQALSALLFLYHQVLKEEIGWLEGVRLMAGLLYGSGLRLMECVRLRVKDVDFGYARITSDTGMTKISSFRSTDF
jgi:integrase